MSQDLNYVSFLNSINHVEVSDSEESVEDEDDSVCSIKTRIALAEKSLGKAHRFVAKLRKMLQTAEAEAKKYEDLIEKLNGALLNKQKENESLKKFRELVGKACEEKLEILIKSTEEFKKGGLKDKKTYIASVKG